MAKPELGAKQLCPQCGAKFYDLNKRPAVCPKCQAAFDPEEVVKVRKTRRGPGAADYEDDETPKPAPEADNDGFEEEADDTPEIDQAIDDDVLETDDEAEEEVAGAAKPAPTEDLGVDFAVDDEDVEGDSDDEDDVFLEDEDDEFSEDDIGGLPGEDEDRD